MYFNIQTPTYNLKERVPLRQVAIYPYEQQNRTHITAADVHCVWVLLAEPSTKQHWENIFEQKGAAEVGIGATTSTLLLVLYDDSF